ncbi:MAG TPA: LuxR C-terminal-related transcriptional regulator, partial [Actinomycetota bacterium]|nr:LuxR C-terminal-related transcriptional regulator [Actinomycetota bacterium]
LARLMLSSPAVALAADAASRRGLKAAEGALQGPAEPEMASLSAEDRMVRAFDRAAVALRAVAGRKPLFLALDDLQWADEDSLRLIRYLVRTEPNVPLLLVLAFRREAARGASALLGLSVDAERLGVGRRVMLERLTAPEATELLQHLLGGPASSACAQALYGQSEGVPFILEELVRTFRENGTVRSIEGTWQIAGSVRVVPSSVQSLIERKAAALPEATREVLGDAAAIGRRFSLQDLAAVTRALRGDGGPGPADLATMLTPAVHSGLLAEVPEGGRADYTFTHDSARAVLAEAQGRPRRRLAHRAVLDLIADGGEPPRHRLAEAAHHAILGGERERGVRYALQAARDALTAGAGDEALRIVAGAMTATDAADDQLELLRLQDDALEMLGRPVDRGRVLERFARVLEGRRDEGLEFELMRRRASAARGSGDVELAADLARLTREQAAAAGNRRAELEACLELGQALMRAPLGEAYNPPPTETDLDAAEEAFQRALALADEAGEERLTAACLRELGAIQNGRAKGMAVEQITPSVLETGRFHLPADDDPRWGPIDERHTTGKAYLERALEIFERLDDRAGVMSTVIALSYAHYHSGVERGVAGVIEQIRRLRSRLKSMTTESERQRDEAEMLFSVHAYARFYHQADLALLRGIEAHRAARSFGIRWLEFASAGGVALTHLELGEPDEAEEWLDRARAAAMVQLGPLRARQLDLWRGLARAASGDVDGAVERLERARTLATEQRNRPGQTEAMTALALQGALLAAERDDAELARRAEPWAEAALALAGAQVGHHPWRAQARAAIAQLALLRGDPSAAADQVLLAVAEMDARLLEPVLFEVLLVAARVARAADRTDRDQVLGRIRWDVADVAERIVDDDVRARWLAAPVQAAIVDIAGRPEPGAPRPASGRAARLLTDHERRILAGVARGMTNREISAELDLDVRSVGKDLAGVFTKLGVRSRGAATTVALREGLA